MTYRYVAFGAGRQSTALVLLCLSGRIRRPDSVVFADTLDEPGYVYETLRIVESRCRAKGVPFRKVSAGWLGQAALQVAAGERKRFSTIPLHVDKNGRTRRLRRCCTRDYKIRPIERWVRDQLRLRGLPRKAEAMLGISVDEAHRMKPSRTPWVTTAYPLVEEGLTAEDCVRVCEEAGVPVGRSSCVYCPFHGADYWRTLRREHPYDFQRACFYDSKFRDLAGKAGIAGVPFVHPSLRPLSELASDPRDSWGEECEGYCGL